MDHIFARIRSFVLAATTLAGIEMHYGDATLVSSQENVTAVWDSSSKGVRHLSEDPSGAAPQMRDSTIENNDGISFGGTTLANQVSNVARSPDWIATALQQPERARDLLLPAPVAVYWC